HKPTNEELKDFKAFVEEEQSGDKIATELLQKLSEDKYLMSVIYYRDESPIGGKGYQVYNWTEFYFLDFSKNELIHISYGKF
ncbi:MAG TPA: hypothetical protein DD434_12820, partial [Bacteroidales bacterium]|nr:hypothetical protein [Bacteroidales bacterium]